MGNTPDSRFYNVTNEKEKQFLDKIEKINFKELFMEKLTPEFLKLFKENANLFYSQPFYEGISYEYGLFNKKKDKKRALKIYKEAADFKYDYLCMYRMFRIFLTDYKDFGLKRYQDLYRFYLYKCFAYLPYSIMSYSYSLLNKIEVNHELAIMFDYLDNDKDFETFKKFLDYLTSNKEKFNVTMNDIKLMKNVILIYFKRDYYKKNIKELDCLLEFEKGDNAYYEAKLKYCYFYILFSEHNCNTYRVKNIFEKLIEEGYYKAYFDYGSFLLEKCQSYDKAKSLFKEGFDKSQHFCLDQYIDMVLWTTDFKQILTDYKTIQFILKNFCIRICIDKLGTGSFFYTMYYLCKHTSFKQNIINDFGKYAKELFDK